MALALFFHHLIWAVTDIWVSSSKDSMAICRTFQKPDLFITMTANPNWPEIQDALLQEELPDPNSNARRKKQTAYDRPDIVARVFEQKKNALLKDIRGGVFGKVLANIHTVEFQKRGLPHMHLLTFLDPANKFIMPMILIPSYGLSFLIQSHNLCSMTLSLLACFMVPVELSNQKHLAWLTKKCSKRYPKEFRDHTAFNPNNYPEYARPNNGRTIEKGRPLHLYNIEMSSLIILILQPSKQSLQYFHKYSLTVNFRYNCHINVEICSSIEAVKYIHKYITRAMTGPQSKSLIKT